MSLTSTNANRFFDFKILSNAVNARLGRHEVFAQIMPPISGLQFFEKQSHRSGHNKTTEVFFGRLAVTWARTSPAA
jgi:hypothetical protein